MQISKEAQTHDVQSFKGYQIMTRLDFNKSSSSERLYQLPALLIASARAGNCLHVYPAGALLNRTAELTVIGE